MAGKRRVTIRLSLPWRRFDRFDVFEVFGVFEIFEVFEADGRNQIVNGNESDAVEPTRSAWNPTRNQTRGNRIRIDEPNANKDTKYPGRLLAGSWPEETGVINQVEPPMAPHFF